MKGQTKKTQTKSLSDFRDVLVKKALGYDVKEVVEEYVSDEDGEIKLTKKKVTKKNVPPDLTALKILLDGEDITGLSITERAKKGISFAFQQPVRFKGITVHDLISLSIGREISISDACNYLSEVGLCARDYINREVNASLSGGELKRIEIATVLARGTKVSLFDEPEAGIDLWSFNNLIKVFEKMRDTLGGSIMIISHQERILNIADKVIVVANGTVKEEGKKEDILPSLLGKADIACKVLTANCEE